ncbi:MAG: transposase [Verrucomicrobia bacterium]|jgi:putative transposase|nr:transposase [Verrucomicrobiota bacterium]
MQQTDIDDFPPLVAEIRELIEEESMVAAFDYMLAENRIYRAKFGKRVPLTQEDRRILARYGVAAREWLAQICTVMQPESLLRLNRRLKQAKWDYSDRVQRPGRPATEASTEALVVRLAEENGHWGYDRIAGELKKLGHDVCDQTVGNILKRHGVPKAPDRKGMTWKQFIESHMTTAWACDFFTEEVWTRAGLMTFYVLFFIHLGTRRIYVANVTMNPNAAWVRQQSRNFSMHLGDVPQTCTHLIHDRDTSFLAMDAVLSDEMEIVRTPAHAPKCNAFAERFVREARGTLDNLILCGERQLFRTMKTIEKHHNTQRPHQGIDNCIPLPFEYPDAPLPTDKVVCSQGMGGLLNHYEHRKAA